MYESSGTALRKMALCRMRRLRPSLQQCRPWTLLSSFCPVLLDTVALLLLYPVLAFCFDSVRLHPSVRTPSVRPGRGPLHGVDVWPSARAKWVERRVPLNLLGGTVARTMSPPASRRCLGVLALRSSGADRCGLDDANHVELLRWAENLGLVVSPKVSLGVDPRGVRGWVAVETLTAGDLVSRVLLFRGLHYFFSILSAGLCVKAMHALTHKRGRALARSLRYCPSQPKVIMRECCPPHTCEQKTRLALVRSLQDTPKHTHTHTLSLSHTHKTEHRHT
jgi:hypothetical protein